MNQRILDYIDKISETVAGVSKHAYEMLIRQQIVHGIFYIVLPLAFLLMLMIAILVVRRWKKRAMIAYKNDEEQLYYFHSSVSTNLADTINFVLILASVVLPIVAVISTAKGVAILLNPEYYAIKDIIETIKGR